MRISSCTSTGLALVARATRDGLAGAAPVWGGSTAFLKLRQST